MNNLMKAIKTLPLTIAIISFLDYIVIKTLDKNQNLTNSSFLYELVIYQFKSNSLFKFNYLIIINLLSIIFSFGLFDYKKISFKFLIVSAIGNFICFCLVIQYVGTTM